jgi:hypothetical protein
MCKCPYSGNCTDEGYKCTSCRHNKGKKSHYEPERCWPPYPYTNPTTYPKVPYVITWNGSSQVRSLR